MGWLETLYLGGRVAMALACLAAAGMALHDLMARRATHQPRLILALLVGLLTAGVTLSLYDAWDTLTSAGGIRGADWAWFLFDLGVPLLALRVILVMRQRDAALARLAELADRDPLTGAANRRGFETLAGMALRLPGPACVIALDIDRFKRINDGWGHPAGDAVLRATVAAMAGALRQSDVLGRVGGEEFCVALPATRLAEAAALAERLRAAVRAAVPHPAGAGEVVTLSAGVAAVNATGLARLEVALVTADAALYRAKQAGRDRVEVSPV